MPRHLIGVKAAKDGEEETKEQRENRLARAIKKNTLLKRYKAGEEINEVEKEIIERLVNIQKLVFENENDYGYNSVSILFNGIFFKN